MTITIGSWVIPLAITVFAMGAFAVWQARQPPASGYGALGAGVVELITFGVAVIASLVVWLIWAVLT